MFDHLSEMMSMDSVLIERVVEQLAFDEVLFNETGDETELRVMFRLELSKQYDIWRDDH
jgi:hypothetical protein